MADKEKEVWKDYTGEVTAFHKWIKVSNLGRVYKIGGRTSSSKILHCTKNSQGYMRVHVSIHGKIYNKPVHRLVAEMFCPNPHNKPYVDHKNAVRDDNRASNLHWVTSSENNKNPHYKKLLSERVKKQLRKRNYLAESLKKPCILENVNDHTKLRFNSLKEANEFFNASADLGSHIKSGKPYTSAKSKLKGWKVYYADK